MYTNKIEYLRNSYKLSPGSRVSFVTVDLTVNRFCTDPELLSFVSKGFRLPSAGVRGVDASKSKQKLKYNLSTE